jgi:2-deoxy-D-gluconate 3-dehydrogenase
MTNVRSGKLVAIVAGGTGGIGAAICRRLRDDGYEVVSAARWRTSAVPSNEPGITQICCDVTSPAECESLVQSTLDRFGRIDGVVYAVIGYYLGPPESHDAQTVHEVFAANVYGALYLSSCCFSLAMKQAECGSVCFIGSTAAVNILPGRAAYGASKAALVGLCRALAVDWAYANVRVNTVSPAYVSTPLELLGAASGEWGHSLEELLRRTPSGRLSRPEDVAEAVAWMLSPASSCVTGSDLVIDGGWSAWSGFGKL